MKTAFLLLGLLVFSVFATIASMAQTVEALSAVGVSDGATITSLNTGRWAKVWVNPAATIVYFLDHDSTNVKVVKVNATDGSTISTNSYAVGNGVAGQVAISEVFTLSGDNYIIYAQKNSGTATSMDVDRLNIDSGAFTSATGATTCTTQVNPLAIYVTKNKVYYVNNNNNNSSLCTSKSNLDLSSITSVVNGALNSVVAHVGNRCEVAIDGTTEAGDVAYCLLPRSVAGGTVIAKFANGVYSQKAAIAGSNAITEASRAGDLFIGRTETGGVESTITLTISTDTYNDVQYTTDWINWNAQAYHLTDTTRIPTPVPQFLATSNSVIAFDSATGEETIIRMPAVTVDVPTASISWFTDTFYRLSNTLYATVVTTTTTPKVIGAGVEIAPTAYEETIGVPLLEDISLFHDDVFKILCDANYVLPNGKLFVGSDSDCTQWQILDVDSNPVGRELPYTRTSSLVHADEYTNYVMHVVSTEGGSADEFDMIVSYTGVDVDRNGFDGGNNAEVRLLAGQCYDVQYVRSSNGEVVDTTTICGDDVVFKEGIISTSLGFSFWTLPWGISHVWDSDNEEVDVLVRHDNIPYNYTITITNSTGTELINDEFESLSEVDTQNYDMSSYTGQPFHLVVKDDNDFTRYNAYFGAGGGYLAGIGAAFETLEFEGWSLLMFLPIIFAAMFTRSTAGIGGGMLVAFIGVLFFLGIIPTFGEDTAMVMAIITFIAVIGLIVHRQISN